MPTRKFGTKPKSWATQYKERKESLDNPVRRATGKTKGLKPPQEAARHAQSKEEVINVYRRLPRRYRLFIDYFDGANDAEAVLAAGYKAKDDYAARAMARKLLNNPDVAFIMKNRHFIESNYLIANRKRRQQFWSEIMLDDGRPIGARLKASEYLAKSEADFVERKRHEGEISIVVSRPRDATAND
jgi:phage terminase small subunit